MPDDLTDFRIFGAHVPVHLAHNWFVSRRGGERTVEEISRLFPCAAISTLFCDPSTLSTDLQRKDIRVSPLGKLAPRFCDHRKLLPLYPWAARRLRAPEGARLLISSDASLVKGMLWPDGCRHVCYCHSPPRYLWDMSDEYAQQTAGLGVIGRRLFQWWLPRLRSFDRSAAERVDLFIANSHFVADRIRRSYGREATVLAPPVEISRFNPKADRGDYYLVVSELVSYKRVDLAIDACLQTGRRLVVAGHGPEAARLRDHGGGKVDFRGRVTDEEIASLMAGCRAFLHPQMEDFGIAAVEAQAAGSPVIAFRGGGALETIHEGSTGMFFNDQTAASLREAIQAFESQAQYFTSAACRRNAERFAPAIFRSELRRLLLKFDPAIAKWL